MDSASGDYAYDELSPANSAIWTAISEGKEQGVKEAINNGANVDFLYNGTYTALHLAASKGHTNIVKLLLDAGWDIDLVGEIEDTDKSVVFEGTPIHHAADNGHIETVKFLLEKGADVNASDGTTQYYTPLLTACRSGHLKLVEFLIQNGADTSAVDGAGEPLINIAADFGHVQILKYLIEKGFSVNATSLIHTPLIAATESEHVEAVKFLLQNGANVNGTPEARQDTALHAAAVNGNVELIKLLLQNKADKSLKNAEGKTPLEVASKPEAVAALK